MTKSGDVMPAPVTKVSCVMFSDVDNAPRRSQRMGMEKDSRGLKKGKSAELPSSVQLRVGEYPD